jgi:hypothetical protein
VSVPERLITASIAPLRGSVALLFHCSGIIRVSDKLAVALNEAVQYGKGLGRQVNFRRASPQQRIIRIEPKGREAQAPRCLYLHCSVVSNH